MSAFDSIMKKISDKSVVVGVIGLGYVGQPLAVSFARKGVTVMYHDPYVPEVPDDHGRTWKGVERIVSKARLVVDTCNAVKNVRIEDGKVFKL